MREHAGPWPRREMSMARLRPRTTYDIDVSGIPPIAALPRRKTKFRPGRSGLRKSELPGEMQIQILQPVLSPE